jgi:serine/threonine protein kinase
MGDLSGSYLGRYRIIERLGQGGMATVYKAYDTRLERDVAIKTIRTDMFPPAVLPDVLARFEREAKALARLDHPNIVRVHDFGEHDNIPYLVMAFVTGGSLRDRTGRVYTEKEAATLLAPVARALEYAHLMGILHRDIKPANILINSRGIPLLSDFGIAKILDTENNQGLTATGMAIGTPEYMAPEQSSGDKVDARADIYALGVVLFELLSGRRPFEGNTPIDVMIKTRTAQLPTLRSLGLQVSPQVEIIVQRALARDTSERYASMAAFADDLESLAVPSPKNVTQENLEFIDTTESARPSDQLRLADQVAPDDSGRTITNPPVQASGINQLDSGRTITTPSGVPNVEPGMATVTAQGNNVEKETEVIPPIHPPIPPPPPASNAKPTSNSSKIPPEKIPQRKSPAWIFGIIALLLALMGGGVIWVLYTEDKETALPTQTVAATTVVQDLRIRIWDTWSDDLEFEATRRLLDQFQATKPGLVIEYARPGEQDILEAIKNGSGPDIIIQSNEHIWMIAEGLVPLNQQQQGLSTENMQNRFTPVAISGVTWQEEIWGVPLAQKAIAIVYNKNLATPLDFPKDPNDLDSLTKEAFEYQRRTGKHLICNPGLSTGDAYFSAPFFFSMGMPGYINESGDVYVNSEAGREAGRIIKSWKITAGPQEADYDTCKTLFMEGNVGAWWIGPWETWLFDNKEMNLAIAPFGKPFVTLRTASITKNAIDRKNALTAIEIISFLAQPESQARMALEAFSIPTSEMAISTPQIINNSLITGFFIVSGFGVPMSPSPFTTVQWEPMGEAIRKIWAGEQIPAEALLIAQKQITEAIAKMK